ncbi:hypothetical protein MVEN_02331200 [Mycena venus]|uniref:Uncharacterized protein n=1 Tax=Mycena venus TaxID=2733690 RepID=A0A8H7CEQ9_9AGAR|nr:hypothetical protein MVEN_02331200 [Mycena venus]
MANSATISSAYTYSKALRTTRTPDPYIFVYEARCCACIITTVPLSALLQAHAMEPVYHQGDSVSTSFTVMLGVDGNNDVISWEYGQKKGDNSVVSPVSVLASDNTLSFLITTRTLTISVRFPSTFRRMTMETGMSRMDAAAIPGSRVPALI